MSDPLRTDGSRALDAASGADHDAKIEHLLLAGLDCYFAAQYEQAINIWTRALFIDRGHARARAYIDRARRALAERQRQGEELLQNGIAALDRGQADEARRLLLASIESGAPAEQAHDALRRLERRSVSAGLEPGSVVPALPPADQTLARGLTRPPGRSPSFETSARRHRATWASATVLGIAALALAVYSAAGQDRLNWRSFFSLQEAPLPAVAPVLAPDRELPRPQRGELALARGRTLAASGRLHDALAVLDQVRATDPQKAEADRLKSDLQRRLLDLVRTKPPQEADQEAAGSRPR